MDFAKKAQPTWPFPPRFDVEPVKPKPQPKAPYRDNFSQPLLGMTWQSLGQMAPFGKRWLNC